MARPTKLTPTVHDSIVKSISAGVAIRTACRACGVGDSTYRGWLERANDEDEPDDRFRRFRDAIARAEHDLQSTSVAVIRRDDDWRAHSDFLRRRFPNEWSEKVVEEHTGPGGGPIEHRGIALSEVLELARKAGVDVSQSPPADD